MTRQPDLTRRDFLRWAALSALGGPALMSACARDDRPGALNFLNWSGYIADDTLTQFEEESGIHVNYAVYRDEENLLAQVAGAPGGYDLIVAPHPLIPRLRAERVIVPIDHSRLPKLKDISRRFANPAYDPGLAHGVPYLWGTTGIGFNASRVRPAPDTWRALWDRKFQGRVSMSGDARELIECALLVLGLPTDLSDIADAKKARGLLLDQRPLVKKYDSSSVSDGLRSGDIWLAQAWNGDVVRASRSKPEIDFRVPREGGFYWMDSLCVARGGQSEHALRLIDFLLRPEIAARISNFTGYATPNEAALAKVDPALRDDARVYPPPQALDRLRLEATADFAVEALGRSILEVLKRG